MNYQDKIKSLNKNSNLITLFKLRKIREDLLTQILDQEILLILIFLRRMREIREIMETMEIQ